MIRVAWQNYTGKSNSFGTGYVDSLFKKQYNFSPRKTDRETIERIYNSLEARKRMTTELPQKRSMLDRTFDALLVGNYAVAGAVDGLVRDDKTMLEGIVGGLKAANPFGKGFEEGETTFSDVLRSGMDRAGIDHPDSFLGKALVGTAGFALDVLLDPTTYMTFGTSALIKGTGKVGTAVSTIEKLAKESPEFAQGLKEAGALTDEMSMSIVERMNAGKQMSNAQLLAESKELKNKYNQLIGVERNPVGISIGVQNMPFGDKIAKKLGIEKGPIDIVKGSTLQRVSDLSGVSRGYQATRNAVYGSKIGKYLSNNAGLKGLAEMNPAKLYEYIGAVNVINGKNLDKMARDKEIREIGTKMLGLSPSEHKEIIKALETPSVWTKVKDNLKFGQTEASKQMKADYAQQVGRINNEVSDLKGLRDEYTNASEAELRDYQKQLQVLNKRKDLSIKQTEQLKEIESEIEGLVKAKTNAGQTAVRIEELSKQYDKSLADYQRMYEAEGEEVAVSRFNSMEPEAISENFASYQGGISDLDKRIGESSGATRQALLGQKNLLQGDLRNDVSEYFFGKGDFITRDANPDAIRELASLIRAGQSTMDEFEALVNASKLFDGATKEALLDSSTSAGWNTALREFIENNPNFVDNSKRKIYSHLANKYGYKNFSDVLEQRATLLEALRRDKSKRKPNSSEMIELNRLNGIIDARNNELAQLSKLSPKELAKTFEEAKFAELSDEIDYLLFGDAEMAGKYKDAINQYSEGARGRERDAIGYYGKMQKTDTIGMTPEQAEYERFKELTNDKKYTIGEIMEDKDDLKATLLRARQKRLFESSITPETIDTVASLRKQKALHDKLSTEYNALVQKAQQFPSKRLDNIVDRVGQKMVNADKEVQRLTKHLKEKTNYNQAVRSSKNLSDEEVLFLDKQSDSILSLTNKLFPQHRYQHLTSGQRKFIQTTAYYMVRDYRAKGGDITQDGIIQKLVDETFEKNIRPQQEKMAKEALTKQKEQLVSDKVDVGMGVKIETEEGIVNAIITGKKEVKETKTREQVEVTYKDGGEGQIERRKMKKGEIDPNTGKPLKKDREILIYNKPKSIREETINTFKYEEGTGVYQFEARLPDGSTIKVDPNTIKGTFVDEMHYDTTVLPAYTKQELEDAFDYAQQVKDRISKLKDADTKHAGRIEQADKMLEELMRRKEGLESNIKMFNDIDNEIQDTLETLKANSDTLGDSAKQLDDKINELNKRKDEIEKALDDDDALELLVKRDLGSETFNKLMDEASITDSARIGLDDMPFSDAVKFYAKNLKDEFNKAGLSEVEIGKLDQGAFESMMERYFPRVLTEDAKKFFKDNPTQAQKYGQVTNKFGFGQEWTPYSKTRKADFETTKEANDYFQSEIGMRIFEENVGTAYINRMLTNSDVVYDHNAMNDLMRRFGHGIGADNKLMDGYTAVANYGAIRDHIRVATKDSASDEIKAVLARKQEIGESAVKEQIDEIYQRHTEKIVDALKLDRKLIAGETTPLIRLNEEQIKAFKQERVGYLARQINDVTVSRMNQQKQLIMERDERQLLKMYDKFMTFIKMNQTTLMPGFWVQTKVGNTFQGWMGVGRDVFDTKMNKTAVQAIRNVEDIAYLRSLGPIEPTDLVNGKVYYWDETVDLARTYGVINTDYMTKDFASHSYMEGTKVLPAKFDPFNTTEFIPYQVGGKITSTIDNSDRLLQFSSLLRQGKTPQEASDIVTKHLFDYGDLTNFEKRVMKRIFPYYTWMRKNTPLIMRQVIEEPEKMALMAKIHSSINSSNGDDAVDRTFVTGFAQDWIQLPFNITGKDGQEEPVLFNPKLPYMDMRNISSGDGLGGTMMGYFNQTSPFLKLPIELTANWNSFFDEPIAREGEPQLTPRLIHVMSQLSAFNAVNNFVKAEGDDKLLSAVNTFTGQKMTSYNIEQNKENVYREAYEAQFERGVLEVIGSGIVRTGQALDEGSRKLLSNVAVTLAGRPPMTANEYDGALSPITPERYVELSDAEKQKYSLSKEQGIYLNKRAQELSEQAYKDGGGVKNFMWMLIEGEYPGGQTVGRINKVVDGDTFRTTINGESKDIRLLMIDTPESVGAYKDNPMAFGQEASDYSKSLLLGKDVRLYIDSQDKYGRITAFVEVGGKDVGKELIDKGLGRTRYEDMAKGNYTTRLEDYYNREAEVSKEGTGLWSNLLSPHYNR